jgi:hypothetical protein
MGLYAIIPEKSLSDRRLSATDIRVLAGIWLVMNDGVAEFTVPSLATKTALTVGDVRKSIDESLIVHGYFVRDERGRLALPGTRLGAEGDSPQKTGARAEMVQEVTGDVRKLMSAYVDLFLGEAMPRAVSTFWSASYNRASATALIRSHGIGTVLDTLRRLSESSEDDYCPRVKSIRDMELKWHRIAEYLKKRDRPTVISG